MDPRFPINPRRLGPLEWLIAVLSVATLAAYGHRWLRLLGFHWDISVYERAVADYAHGADAYRRDAFFPFVYHPFTLRLLALLDHLLTLRVLLPALTLCAVGWLFLEFGRTALPRNSVSDAQSAITGRRELAFAMLAAAGFGGIGAAALMSGNMSPCMHWALLAAFLRARRVNGVLPHYVPYGLILLFALVKPYMLIYLAVPVLLNQRKVAALLSAAAVVVLFAATWLAFKALWPGEYASFVANLGWHILNRGDLGYTFFYVFGVLTRKLSVALELHCAVSVLLIALVPLLLSRKYGPDSPFVPKLALLYLVLTLANPRMKDYDLFPALAGFFAVLGVLVPRGATPITLAGSLFAAVPVFVEFFAPSLAARHPLSFDPYGNWQIVGLALIAVLFLVAMLYEAPRPERHARALIPL